MMRITATVPIPFPGERSDAHPSALIAATVPDTVTECKRVLSDRGYDLISVSSAHEALRIIAVERVAVVVCATELADGSFRDLLRVLQLVRWRVPVIVASSIESLNGRIEALELGAAGWVSALWSNEEIIEIIEEAVGAKGEPGRLREMRDARARTT